MSEKYVQETIHKKSIQLIQSIIDYFKTLFSVLLHPIKFFNRPFNVGDKSTLMKPGTFLVINILIAHLVSYSFGYDVPKFPFKIELGFNLFGNLRFLILRYILGILLFLMLLWLFIKQFKLINFINKMFPVISYASAIYIPYAFIHGLNGQLIGQYLINSSTAILQNITVETLLIYIIKILFSGIALIIIFIVLWLLIIYLGMKHINKSSFLKFKKAIIISPIIFVIIQLSTILMASYFMNKSTMDALSIVYMDSIHEILSQKSPNYLQAIFLSDQVSINKQMPEYARYAYKLIKISSAIAIPTFSNDRELISKILTKIKDRDYKHAEKLIGDHINSLSANIDLKKEFKEIVEIRNSSTFVNLKGKTVTLSTKLVDDLESSSPDLIRVNEKNYIYVCPIVISTALISILP